MRLFATAICAEINTLNFYVIPNSWSELSYMYQVIYFYIDEDGVFCLVWDIHNDVNQLIK